MKGMIMLKTFLVSWNIVALGLAIYAVNFGYEFHFLFVKFVFSGAQIVFLSWLAVAFEQKIIKVENFDKSMKKTVEFV